MPDRGAPPEDITQGYASLDVEYVDRLPGDKPFMLLAANGKVSCLAVRDLFTPQVRDQVARDIHSLSSLGLWPYAVEPPQTQEPTTPPA